MSFNNFRNNLQAKKIQRANNTANGNAYGVQQEPTSNAPAQNTNTNTNANSLVSNGIKSIKGFSFSDAKTKGFKLDGLGKQLREELNSQSSMGSEEADSTDPSKMHGFKGMIARAKSGSLFGKNDGAYGDVKGNSTKENTTSTKEETTDENKDDENKDDENKKKDKIKIDIPETEASFNPTIQISSLSSDAHLKDFFLACYADNPYLKNIIKTKLMSEYFN